MIPDPEPEMPDGQPPDVILTVSLPARTMNRVLEAVNHYGHRLIQREARGHRDYGALDHVAVASNALADVLGAPDNRRFRAGYRADPEDRVG